MFPRTLPNFPRPALGTTFVAVIVATLLGAPLANAAKVELRPESDARRGWAKVNAPATWAALDDQISRGSRSTGDRDLISARAGKRITAVNLAEPQFEPEATPTQLSAHFLARTGIRTRVRVKLTSGDETLAQTTVKPRARSRWRSLKTTQFDLQEASDLQLQFRSRQKRAKVQAAYVDVETHVPGEPTAGVDVTVHGSTRTIRLDEPTPDGGSNAAKLTSARNEFESFQVVADATGENVKDLEINLAGALTGPGGATIAPGDVTIYREEYYKVSAADGKPRSSRKGAEGQWPDALIPEEDPYYGEDRSAFPVDITSGKKAVAWVDVFVGSGKAPGEYTGSLDVSDSNGLLTTVPIRVKVSNFSMPSTSSLRSAFLMTPPGYYPCRAHRAADWCYPEEERNWKLDYLYARAALENRITIPNAMPGPFQAAPTSPHFKNYMLPLIQGTDNGGIDGTRAPRLSGAKLTSVTAMWQCVVNPGCLSNWRSIAQAGGFEDRFFAYVCDEPSSQSTPEYWNDWRDCSQNAVTAEQAWPGVQTLVTSTIQSANQAQSDGKINVNRDIDIITPPLNYLANRVGNPQTGNQRPAYDAFANQGDGTNEVWTYSYCAQFSCDELESSYFDGWPAYAIDQPASQARAMGWMAYRYRLDGELYYNTTLTLDTAWKDQYRFGGNGDGNLFYPGSPSGFGNSPAIGGQHDIPIESIRMKRIRDGREDYELLHELDRRGLGAQANSILTSLVGPADTAMFSNDVSQGAVDSTRCALMTALDPTLQTCL